MKKKVTFFTGSGISKESGIPTFRDCGDGMWNNYSIEDVATPGGWNKDYCKVLEFYNLFRRMVRDAKPNAAHLAIANLEHDFEVSVVTQNVDDLHERAGSSNVIHLHGEIMRGRSQKDPTLLYNITDDILVGDLCEFGEQIRPHVVWFEENVLDIQQAYKAIRYCDIFVIVGTSMTVYPASELITYTWDQAKKFLVDPQKFSTKVLGKGYKQFNDLASVSVPKLCDILKTKFK